MSPAVDGTVVLVEVLVVPVLEDVPLLVDVFVAEPVVEPVVVPLVVDVPVVEVVVEPLPEDVLPVDPVVVLLLVDVLVVEPAVVPLLALPLVEVLPPAVLVVLAEEVAMAAALELDAVSAAVAGTDELVTVSAVDESDPDSPPPQPASAIVTLLSNAGQTTRPTRLTFFMRPRKE